jgi:hypothetical protein
MKWTYCKDKMPDDYRDIIYCTIIDNDNLELDVIRGFYYSGNNIEPKWFFEDDDDAEGYLPEEVYAWAYWPNPAPLPEEVDNTAQRLRRTMTRAGV